LTKRVLVRRLFPSWTWLFTDDAIGYTSSAAVGLRDALLDEASKSQVQIHSRILGNVIYLMASMTAKREHLTAVEAAFTEKLQMAGKGR
jgi:dethiobiotin synthetase/adenosylmethionine--8-amino-7-oxononanoate aminotransferase